MKLTNGSNYLKADKVEKGTVITFLDAGAIEISDKYRYKNEDGTDGDFRKSLIFGVTYKGENKKLRVNTSSKIALIEAFGEDTDSWVGKNATIHVLPTPNGGNKMIVLDPIVSKPEVKSVDDIAWKD